MLIALRRSYEYISFLKFPERTYFILLDFIGTLVCYLLSFIGGICDVLLAVIPRRHEAREGEIRIDFRKENEEQQSTKRKPNTSADSIAPQIVTRSSLSREFPYVLSSVIYLYIRNYIHIQPLSQNIIHSNIYYLYI